MHVSLQQEHSHPTDLCETCPLRTLGLRSPADLSPNSDAVTWRMLRKGSVLRLEQTKETYALLRRGTLKVEYVGDRGQPEIAGFLFAGEPVVAPFSAHPMQLRPLDEVVLCSFDAARVIGSTAGAGNVVQSFARAAVAQAIEDHHRLMRARSGEVVERVQWFLDDVAKRQGRKTIRLKMSREDIAQYLHVSTESISRALTTLEHGKRIRRAETRLIELL